MDDRDLCGNCGHWREEHYGSTGEWQGGRIGCSEYQGERPTEARRAKKPDEVRASREKIAKATEKEAAAFYGR